MERDKLQEVIDSLNELKIGHRETAIIMAERFASIDLHLTRLNSWMTYDEIKCICSRCGN